MIRSECNYSEEIYTVHTHTRIIRHWHDSASSCVGDLTRFSFEVGEDLQVWICYYTHTKALSKDHANVIFSNYSGKNFSVQYLKKILETFFYVFNFVIIDVSL